MKHKAIIVMMFGIACFIILKRWYDAGNSGLPNPRLIAAPSYLYGTLALAGDFLEGLPTVLAVALTVGLFYATHPGLESSEASQNINAATPQKGVAKNAAGKPVPSTGKVKA